MRKVKEGETTNDLFAFLPTEPNAGVESIHAKVMPVILATQDETDQSMAAPVAKALALQRPLPDGTLKVVSRGEKQHGPG